MPNSVWGYSVGDDVEFLSDGQWTLGTVLFITTDRQPVVQPQEGLCTRVMDPRHIRRWERPSTPDSIEAFLNQ